MLVFFDLPTFTKTDIRNYTLFKRFLDKEGFVMMQESVYSKILLNGVMAELLRSRIRKSAPPKGKVQILLVTERQFCSMDYVVGKAQSTIVDTDERVVVM